MEDFFSVGSSWLRRHVTSEQFSAWPFSTLTSMLLHITPKMCAGFVKAAVRRNVTYAPASSTREGMQHNKRREQKKKNSFLIHPPQNDNTRGSARPVGRATAMPARAVLRVLNRRWQSTTARGSGSTGPVRVRLPLHAGLRVECGQPSSPRRSMVRGWLDLSCCEVTVEVDRCGSFSFSTCGAVFLASAR